jgi:hypothetical protein
VKEWWARWRVKRRLAEAVAVGRKAVAEWAALKTKAAAGPLRVEPAAAEVVERPQDEAAVEAENRRT